MKPKIGFIGQGWIGKNYADVFESRHFEVVRYALEEPYTQNAEKIKDCDIVFVAVPTPTTPEGFDNRILKKVVKLVGKGKIAVIKSTVLPGTTEEIQKDNPDVFVLHSPEFLRETSAAADAAQPSRNIIGIPVESPLYREKAAEVERILPYAPYNLVCSSREAEMIKYGGNNFLYFKVIFANILHDLAGSVGTRWEVVRDAVAADPRIGASHLEPFHKSGRGAGGHCFIKDMAAFAGMYRQLGDEAGSRVLDAVRDKNIELLLETNKDLDLLEGVYGPEILDDLRNRHRVERKARCLVTGGAGFIGSTLVDELIIRGNEVVIIDDLSTGKEEYVNPRAEFHNLDIRNLQDIKPVFEGVDYVFHLAARPRVQFSIDNPGEAHGVNVNGTLNVLIAARDAKVKKFIFSSSSSVYGDQEWLPLHEGMLPNPKSPYALHKQMGEDYCRLFNELYGLPAVCLRYFNVYGRRMATEGAYCLVLSIFTNQRQKGESLTITGDGEQRRDFTYVGDVVAANILAANSANVGRGEVINIGSGVNYSVNEIADMFGGPRVYIEPRIEPRLTLADNSLAQKILGWEPMMNLPEWLVEHKREQEID